MSPDPMIKHEPDWDRLTSLTTKQRLYEVDSYFVEGFGDLSRRLGGRLYECVERHALVLFKPEAVRSRKIVESFDYFRNYGYVPVAASICRFDQATIHSIWRFQLGRATRDRVRLYSRWGDPEPALMVAYRSLLPSIDLPESVRLQGYKGHAFPERRQPGDLRAQLHSPNTLMTFFHAADEPADMVRDMAICIPAVDRMRFIDAMAQPDMADSAGTVEELAWQLYDRVPEASYDPDVAAERIVAAVVKSPMQEQEREAALAYLAEIRDGQRPLVFEEFERCLGSALDRVASYDVFVLATQYIQRDQPNAIVELAGDCVAAWRERSRIRHESARLHHAT
jgi:Nucleoside diphosphate kinase